MILIIVFLPLSCLLVLGSISFYCGRTAKYALLIPLSFTLYETFNYLIYLSGQQTILIFGSFFSVSYLNILWELVFNFFTLFSAGLILLLTIIIQIFTLDYMENEINIIFFLVLLSLFTFMMLLFIYSSNFIFLLVGWEGIGLLSYLLINFWSLRLESCKASLKAIFINKIGDTALLMSFALLFNLFLSTNLTLINVLAVYLQFENILGFSLLSLIITLVIIAGVTKSAQLMFSIWLPDAMEGPTPVSSLLHSATMVASGLILLIKLTTLISQTSNILPILFLIGLITTLIATSESLCTSDTKSALAGSTCEQLGLMFIVYSLSYVNLAFFHFCAHAIYKSLAFISIGLIMHETGESESEFQSSIPDSTDFAETVNVISMAACLGLPGTVGHYSKSLILAALYNQGTYFGTLFFLFTQMVQFTTNLGTLVGSLSASMIGADFSERKSEYSGLRTNPFTPTLLGSCAPIFLSFCVMGVGPILQRLYYFEILTINPTLVIIGAAWLHYKMLPTWVIYNTFAYLLITAFLCLLYSEEKNLLKTEYNYSTCEDPTYYDKWLNLLTICYIKFAYDIGFFCLNQCLFHLNYYFYYLIYYNYFTALLYSRLAISWLLSYQLLLIAYLIILILS